MLEVLERFFAKQVSLSVFLLKMLDVKLKVQSPMLADYMAWLFPPVVKGGPLVVKAGNSMGRLLVAHCRASVIPPVSRLTPATDEPALPGMEPGLDETANTPARKRHKPRRPPVELSLALPDNDATWPLRDKWLYYPMADTKALNMALKATFDIDFGLYYARGIAQGWRKKDVVEAFVVSRGLFSSDCFDALHKRAYRRDIDTLETRVKQLLDKASYIDSNINLTGLSDD